MTPNEFEEASVVRTPLGRYYRATSRREPQLAQTGDNTCNPAVTRQIEVFRQPVRDTVQKPKHTSAMSKAAEINNK